MDSRLRIMDFENRGYTRVYSQLFDIHNLESIILNHSIAQRPFFSFYKNSHQHRTPIRPYHVYVEL